MESNHITSRRRPFGFHMIVLHTISIYLEPGCSIQLNTHNWDAGSAGKTLACMDVAGICTAMALETTSLLLANSRCGHTKWNINNNHWIFIVYFFINTHPDISQAWIHQALHNVRQPWNITHDRPSDSLMQKRTNPYSHKSIIQHQLPAIWDMEAYPENSLASSQPACSTWSMRNGQLTNLLGWNQTDLQQCRPHLYQCHGCIQWLDQRTLALANLTFCNVAIPMAGLLFDHGMDILESSHPAQPSAWSCTWSQCTQYPSSQT